MQQFEKHSVYKKEKSTKVFQKKQRERLGKREGGKEGERERERWEREGARIESRNNIAKY